MIAEWRERRTQSRLRKLCVPRARFVADVVAAVQAGQGYAAGKIGRSQQHWMYYEIVLRQHPAAREQFERELYFHGLKQCGVFPGDPAFYLRFNEFYMPHVRALDALGLFHDAREWELIQHYGLTNRLVYYEDQEPDRTARGDCYLPAFAGKRVLLICPFASLLQQRATKEIYEAVWAKTGAKWFAPASVAAVEFPYGFAPATQQQYPTALELFAAITAQVDRQEYDVALIAASGLGIPLAAHCKQAGKVAIELGGHLQILFGVLGARWRQWKEWQQAYVTDAWIDMPPQYRPQETDVCDAGAYW